MVEAYAFAGTTMTVLIAGAFTGGAFTVLHVIKPSGSSTPPHSHDSEMEVPYVLSGTLGVETEGRSTSVAAGTCIVLPPAQPHRLFNDSSGPVREFLLCTPAHFDRFVAAAGTPVRPYAQSTAMTAEDRQRLVAMAPEFGIQLLPSTIPQGPVPDHAPSTSNPLEVPDERFAVQARLGDSDRDFVLLRGSVTPGLSLSLCSHSDPGCLFVIDGELKVWRKDAPGERKTLGADEVPGSASVNLLMVATARNVRTFATVG
jgi:quercetin dioxygenase-like cupin family protein